MADTKISALAAAGALTGAELLALVQSGASKSADLDAILAYVESQLPGFVGTLRGLSPGDDTPIDTYATALAAYVTGVVQAQALLDAAIGLGSASEAIARLEGDPFTPRDRALQVAAEYPTGLVSILYPTTSGTSKIEDLYGAIVDGDWTGTTVQTSGFEKLGRRGRYERVLSSAKSAPFRVTGAMTLHFVYYSASGGGSPGYATVLTNTASTADVNNYLWGLNITNSYFETYHEKAGAVAVTGRWTRSVTTTNDWALLTITRSATGRTRLYLNGSLLTAISATNGTLGPAGAYIDLDPPTGGTASILYLGKDPVSAAMAADIGLFAFYSAEQSAGDVAAIASLLGYA